MPHALTHVYPQWGPPESDETAPPEEYVEHWYGSMRIVRSRKRMRVLKRRGVPLMDLRVRDRASGAYIACEDKSAHVWAWFVEIPPDPRLANVYDPVLIAQLLS